MRLYPWTPFVTGCRRCLKPSSRSSRGLRSRKVKPWLPTRDTSTHWRVPPGDCGRWGCEMMWNMFFFFFLRFWCFLYMWKDVDGGPILNIQFYPNRFRVKTCNPEQSRSTNALLLCWTRWFDWCRTLTETNVSTVMGPTMSNTDYI